MKDKKSAHRNGVCRSVAFTLVELLSVLGIIAIVVALLIPPPLIHTGEENVDAHRRNQETDTC